MFSHQKLNIHCCLCFAAAFQQERTEELVRKFESVAPSVKEKLAAEEDRRKVQRESNEAMRSKLDHFEKQTEIT